MEKKNFFKILFGYLLRGLLYTVPLALIIYVLSTFFIFLDKLNPTDIPGLGLLLLLASLTIIGFVGSYIIDKPIIGKFNKLLDKVPLLKTVYSAINDLLSAFVGKKKRFNRPVLVKMSFDSPLERIGFITNEDLSELGIVEGKIAVYLPHSYAISGALYIVPIENVTPINHQTAEVMKFIVSGGVTDID
jgi:uncharacterized membrane protein